MRGVVGWTHIVCSVVALGAGGAIFLRPKRNALHRRLGYLYAAAMIVLVVTALLIYRLTGGVNVLHIAAFVSGVTLVLGLYPAVTRRPVGRWFERHYYFMSWSYIGLVAALVAESGTRAVVPWAVRTYGPAAAGWFWPMVGLATALTVAAGAALVHRNRSLAARLMQ